MSFMLCRNKVTNFAKWKRVFDADADSHRAAGLTLERIWSSVDEPNEVFFLFGVGDRKKARAFIKAPDAKAKAKAAGVTGGEYHFLRIRNGY